jgi:methyl-accepting chemotaxis protein
MIGKKHPHKRKLVNYYLSPPVQTRYALINVASIIVGMSALSILAFHKLPVYIDSAVNAVPLEVEPNAVISYVLWSFICVTVGVCLFSFLLSILVTHRMVGPVYVFERHIQNLINGDYSSRITLRKHDEFKPLSILLNRVAEKLESGQIDDLQLDDPKE